MDVEIPRALPPRAEAEMRRALLKLYPPGFADTAAGAETIEVELNTRQHWFTVRYTAWLSSVASLSSSRVLEVGCGTGSSGVPLAAAGAFVDAVDVSPDKLPTAAVRRDLHGLSDRMAFHACNATEIGQRFGGAWYDIVYFPAVLEHMTHQERIASLRAAWGLIRPGGHLVVVDSPNRLWFFDNHTSFTNFFHWLPDDLAVEYARHTPRAGFNNEFPGDISDAPLRLARWGRGVSFHEFEIALGMRAQEWEVSGEWDFRRARDPAFGKWMESTNDGKYRALLMAVAPNVPSPWLEPEIAISVRKP